MLTSNRSFKVLFISNPNSIHTRRWLDWFCAKGHTVGLIADAPLQDPWPGIEIFDIATKYNASLTRWPLWAYWTRQIIQKWQPDILHAHRVSSAGWLGAFSGFHPLVVSAWGSDLLLHPQKSWIANRLAHFSIKKSDLVTAPSEQLVQKSIEFGALPENVHHIFWGVDTNIFFPQGRSVDFAEADKFPLQVLSIRAIKPLYNQDKILHAAKSVLKEFPETQFIFLVHNQDPVYLDKLENLASSLGISSSIEWKHAITPGIEMADLLQKISLVVSIPDHDGTPVSVLEALACGIPVVASDIPSLEPWIVEGKTGYKVPPKDPAAIANAILKTLRDHQFRQNCRSIAPVVIQTRASHNSQMQRMEDLYWQLLDRGKS